ncbi:hypothetical protein QTI33_27410 [Variovorax sp. J22P271]|uniref:hypothetical protein n=1 Tax=Variovorax davisae TaxID=3053515 RepID=UPI002577DA57|nr:hypothetical protein [Variovorax sp. J22P271]MDM0035892.1 hypothetical protein [Variovorax sp. J22P271]
METRHAWRLPTCACPNRLRRPTSAGLRKPIDAVFARLPRIAGREDALDHQPLKETTLRRHLGVTYRKEGYLSPAAQRLVALLRSRGKRLFTSALGDG